MNIGKTFTFASHSAYRVMFYEDSKPLNVPMAGMRFVIQVNKLV